MKRKTEGEQIHDARRALGFDLLDSRQWADSDLVSNALRDRLAEYVVPRALGIADAQCGTNGTHPTCSPVKAPRSR